MNSENILSFCALTISFITLVISFTSFFYFNIFPIFKNFLIIKSFSFIKFFYDKYIILNPYLLLLSRENRYKYITEDLMQQNVFDYSFPKFKFEILNIDFLNFDPFSFSKDKLWKENLKFYEIIKFYEIWKKIRNKLQRIMDILDNSDDYTYIVEKGNMPKYKLYQKNIINKSSISLCPTFDRNKLFDSTNSFVCSNTTKKINFKKFCFGNENKKNIKELKKSIFSININFKNKNENNIIYSYSIYFEHKKIKYIETFFSKNNYILNDENNKKEFYIHKNWIEEAFKINNFDEKIEKLKIKV